MGCHHWESEHPHVFAEQTRPTRSGDADNRLDVTEPTGVRSITPVSIPDARHIACASPAPRRDMCVESAAYHGCFRKTSQAHVSGDSWSITTCRGRISAERRYSGFTPMQARQLSGEQGAGHGPQTGLVPAEYDVVVESQSSAAAAC